MIYKERPADSFKQWLVNMFIATDQWLNAFTGGAPDETISSRMGKRLDTCWFCRIWCGWLHKIDPDHCTKYIEQDEG